MFDEVDIFRGLCLPGSLQSRMIVMGMAHGVVGVAHTPEGIFVINEDGYSENGVNFEVNHCEWGNVSVTREIISPVVFPYLFLEEFELTDILAQAKIGGASHVSFTSSFIDSGWSEPISVFDDDPQVVYKGVDVARDRIEFKIKNYADEYEVLPIKEAPHYRDLEFGKKKKKRIYVEY